MEDVFETWNWLKIRARILAWALPSRVSKFWVQDPYTESVQNVSCSKHRIRLCICSSVRKDLLKLIMPPRIGSADGFASVKSEIIRQISALIVSFCATFINNFVLKQWIYHNHEAFAANTNHQNMMNKNLKQDNGNLTFQSRGASRE